MTLAKSLLSAVYAARRGKSSLWHFSYLSHTDPRRRTLCGRPMKVTEERVLKTHPDLDNFIKNNSGNGGGICTGCMRSVWG